MEFGIINSPIRDHDDNPVKRSSAREPDAGSSHYLRISNAIAADIATGKLNAGDQLPTQRALAKQYDVTQGTINRAYAELARRGLVSGEVGRGSFVKNIQDSGAVSVSETQRPYLIDMAVNKPCGQAHANALRNALKDIYQRRELSSMLTYQPEAGLWKHRECAAQWLKSFGVTAEPGRVAITAGAQQAMAAVVLAVSKPNEPLLVEEYTYTGMKALALALQRKLEPVEMDAQGLIPEALAKAADRTRAKVIYCMPNVHNPTTATLSKKRREQLAEIVQKRNLYIIEDGVYDFLAVDRLPPLVSFVPEQTFYITSLSKCIAPGLRVGYVAAPESAIHSVAAETRSLLWTGPPLMAEIASLWIESGDAQQLVEAQRRETATRLEIAKSALAGLKVEASRLSAHLWLTLPAPWSSRTLVEVVRQRGVALAPTEAFSARDGMEEKHIRLGLVSPPSRDELKRALAVLVETLRQSPRPNLSFT